MKTALSLTVLLLLLSVCVHANDMLTSCRARNRDLSNEIFDFIVIGSGHAGSVIANRLSGDSSNFTVLLLEAGPSVSDADFFTDVPSLFSATFNSPINWSYFTTPQTRADNVTRFMSRIKRIGGCSRGNAHIYNRGTKEDYDEWADELNDSSWRFENLLSYFKKSENNLDTLRSDTWHGRQGEWKVSNAAYVHESTMRARDAALQAGELVDNEHSDGTADGLTFNQVNVVNGERFSIDKAFLQPIVNRPNLYIKPDAHVKRIVFDRKDASGVIFKDNANGGVLKTVFARREVILSAGAIGSPQLLLVSGVGPRTELESKNIFVVEDSPKVGKDFHDHILLGVSVRIDSLETFDKNIATGFATFLTQWILSRTGPFTTNVPELTGLYKSSLSQAYFNGKADMQYIAAPALYVKQASVSEPGNFSFTFAVSLATPFSRGQVTVINDDSETSPLIDPNYLDDERDLIRLREAIRRIRNILAQPAINSSILYEMYPGSHIVTDAQIDAYVKEYVMSGNHPVGSLRMGRNKNQGVVNSHLCVHGLRKLRVADASVMPKIIKTNPASTVVMIAERAAEMALTAAKNRGNQFACQ